MSRRKQTVETPPKDVVLRNLYLKHGCPKKLIVHVGGETIELIDGELRQNAISTPLACPGKGFVAETHGKYHVIACKICKSQFQPVHKREKMCSDKCRKINASELAKQSRDKRAQEIMAVAFKNIS